MKRPSEVFCWEEELLEALEKPVELELRLVSDVFFFLK
jgi:hypothetical protein